MTDNSRVPPPPSRTVRESLSEAKRISDERKSVGDGVEKGHPSSFNDDRSVSDHAVLGFCEILALMFGLPPGEALFRGEPLSLRLFGFIVMGVIFAALGPAWPAVRKKFPQQTLVLSLSRIASDARYWLAIVLVGFLYVASPEMYRRATVPVGMTKSDTGFTGQQVDKKVVAATAASQARLDDMTRQLEAAQKETNALRRQMQNAPPPPRPNYDEPRVYTTKTMAELHGFYKDRTALQGNVFMADEIGKWIIAQGAIQFIRPDGLVFLSGDGGIISCEFNAGWNPKLSAFRNGELMKVVGKIGTVQTGVGPIYLQPCELQ